MSTYKHVFPDQSGDFMQTLLRDGATDNHKPTCHNCEVLERELAFVTDAWKRATSMAMELTRTYLQIDERE